MPFRQFLGQFDPPVPITIDSRTVIDIVDSKSQKCVGLTSSFKLEDRSPGDPISLRPTGIGRSGQCCRQTLRAQRIEDDQSTDFCRISRYIRRRDRVWVIPFCQNVTEGEHPGSVLQHRRRVGSATLPHRHLDLRTRFTSADEGGARDIRHPIRVRVP